VRKALNYMGQLSLSAHLRDSGHRRSPPAKWYNVQVWQFLER